MSNSIIKKIKKSTFKYALLALPLGGLGGGLLTSCSDFLDILPLNDVVVENYWTKKDDVTSVLNSCYESLESPESILRMSVWGEVRSENITPGNGLEYEMNDLLNENVLPNSSLTKWNVMYQTINRCNTVIHYAPEVQKLDPNYTYGQMMANIAEATFIRNLCFFYLVRTFRDIPMSYEPSLDDSKNYEIPATPMKDALDSIAKDLEAVKDFAVKRYVDDSKMDNNRASSNAYENSSRVTRLAIYALLADVNLWRGEWDQTIKYCDLIIDFKKQQYKDKVQNLGDLNDIHEFSGIPLIRESLEGSTLCGNAYNEIFDSQNSFESIFELYFRNNQSQANSLISTYYGSTNQRIGRFAPLAAYYEQTALGKNILFTNKRDCRAYETIETSGSNYAISKYTSVDISMNTTNVTDEASLKRSANRRSGSYSNWIIYRLTDVMLMKAEAQIMKGGEDDAESAFTLINAVNKRAINAITAASDTLVYNDYKGDKMKMEELLLDERNRELMFEGKRWFDLVRMALREGKTTRLANKATEKQKVNKTAIKIRMGDINYIFFPYNREELKLNRYLKQNSAYSDTEEFKQ